MSKPNMCILTVLLTVLILLNVPDKEVKAEPEHIIPIVEELTLTPKEYVTKYSKQFLVDEQTLQKVMHCESGGRIHVYGDNGRAYSVMQFHKPTFESYSKKLGEELDYYSYQDQIKLSAFMFSIGEGDNWTAYRALKNGGTYSFYSNLLQKHYTVHCR